jgi:hypothetical protein
MALFDAQRAGLDLDVSDYSTTPLPNAARPSTNSLNTRLLGSGDRQKQTQLLAKLLADNPQLLSQLLNSGIGGGGGVQQGLGGAPNLGLGGNALGQGPGPQTTNLGRFSNFSAYPSDTSRPFGPGLIFGGGRPFPPSSEFVDAFKTENDFASVQNLLPLIQTAADALNKKGNTGAGTVTDPRTGRKVSA